MGDAAPTRDVTNGVRISSAEGLERSLRKTSPVPTVMLACAALAMVGLLVWSLVGTVARKVSTAGVTQGDAVVCFVSSDVVGNVEAGQAATVDGRESEVQSVSVTPLALADAYQIVTSDHARSLMGDAAWRYEVRLSRPEGLGESDYHTAAITTGEVRPITLVL